MPLRPRHAYAADFRRGLRIGDINRSRSSPRVARICAATQPTSARFELVGFA
jgi:hypothetical protein